MRKKISSGDEKGTNSIRTVKFRRRPGKGRKKILSQSVKREGPARLPGITFRTRVRKDFHGGQKGAKGSKKKKSPDRKGRGARTKLSPKGDFTSNQTATAAGAF